MVATRGRTFKRPWRRSCLGSKLKSSSAPIGRKDSWCFHAVGSSNAPLLGSTAAEGLPRIGRTSIATRWRSCALPQSASCSENFVIPPDVFGQTLKERFYLSFRGSVILQPAFRERLKLRPTAAVESGSGRSKSYRGRMVMLEEIFRSDSTLQRNERVKLAATFWNNVGAGMLIGGVAGAFYLEKPLFWGKVGIAVVGIVLALFFYSVGNRILGLPRPLLN